MKKFDLPPSDKLNSLFNYEPKTGILSWKVSTNNRVKPGDLIRTRYKDGHLAVSVDGRRYLAHRIIWKMMTGSDPIDQIDHIDGNASNNAFANLRESDQSQNLANTKKRRDNTSGIKGVSFHKATGKWRVTIGKAYQSRQFGIYDDLEDAIEAANKHRRQMHGEFARAA